MSEQRAGLVYGIAAYGLWGAFPLFWPLLEPAGAMEILAHRMVWSFVVVSVILLALRRWSWVPRLLREPRRLALLAAAAAAISVNWGLYIWGVNSGHIVETSLGYFINPLVTVMLGVIVLRERLRPAQYAALAVAGVAVLFLAVENGSPPWIALVLAFSFGTYGLLKKTAVVGALEGLTVETAVLAPLALVYLVVLSATGDGTFTTDGVWHPMLLALTGLVTAVPLLFFGAAASRVPLTTLGVLQYLAPTMQFLLGVLFFHESLGVARLLGFCLVWIALCVFTADLLTQRRRQVRLAVPEPV
jgi:chloramphenicol-sensitive protein RarD